MLKAIRISIGDITYDNVDLIDWKGIEDHGFDKIFEEHTIMFRHRNRWFTSHAWNLKLVHISKLPKTSSSGIEFDKIIIDEDKIYGPGSIIIRDQMVKYGIPIFWENGFEKQLAFTCQDGLFVSTDHAIDTICYHQTQPFMRSPSVRSGRSSPKNHHRINNARVVNKH
jgi:hypothetical protein